MNDKNVEEFSNVCKELIELYTKKNHDYGNSFGKTYENLGIISAVTRISDKYNRLCNLVRDTNQLVSTETVEDTLMDLASYAIMTIMEYRR